MNPNEEAREMKRLNNVSNANRPEGYDVPAKSQDTPAQCPDCGEIQGIGNYEECPHMNLDNCAHGVIAASCTQCKLQHTPTPWKVDPKDKRDIRDTRGWHLALTTSPANPTIDGEANAAFIVRAVNCHEELLAFAKLVANATLVAPEWNEKAKQAIAKAEGR